MSGPSSTWDDLQTRVLTALGMSAIGIAAIWTGGWFFMALTAICAGIMIWELTRMGNPDNPNAAYALALIAVLIVGGALPLGMASAIVLLGVFTALTMIWIKKDRSIFVAYGIAVLLACVALIILRLFFGTPWIIWLVLVVVATDTAGYFAGRFLGGPKFWPRVSPKKTWSGTMAGWVGAAGVGAAMGGITGAGPALVLLSIVVAFASQLGDIAESAIKRRVGVKDASDLLPGHGGLLDRFDGLLAAGLVTILMLVLVPWLVLAGQ